MTNEDFIKLLNDVAKKAKPHGNDLLKITSMDQDLRDCGLDSLDMLVVGMYLCEVWDIDNETSKNMNGHTPELLLGFLDVHGARKPNTYEEAVSLIK